MVPFNGSVINVPFKVFFDVPFLNSLLNVPCYCSFILCSQCFPEDVPLHVPCNVPFNVPLDVPC